MKKILCVAGIVMLLASMVFAAGMSKEDLKNLKGTWTGMAYTSGADAQMTLEILNDTEPVKGKVTLINIDRIRASDAPTWTGERISGEADNGVITNKGTIMFIGKEGNVFEIAAMGRDRAGKVILEGWFFAKGVKVDWKLKKK
jgi:hypothetical protein